jgi:hypothetical protein
VATTAPETDTSSTSISQRLALTLPRLSEALLKLSLSSLSSKTQGKVKVKAKEPPSSLKVIEASSKCISTWVPSLIAGIKRDQEAGMSPVSADLSSLVLQGAKDQLMVSCEDVAFWSSSHVIERVLLPLLNSSPPAATGHVLSALTSLLNAIALVNESRAAL